MEEYSLGCLKDPEDRRDYPARMRLPREAPTLPISWSWRADLTPAKDQMGLGCHDEETEVLTSEGWKRFSSFEGNELVATVNPLTRCLEFQNPINYIANFYKGEMYNFSHRSLDCLVTPNHKMFLRPWNEGDRKLSQSFMFREAKDVGWYSGLLRSLIRDGDSGPSCFSLPGVQIGPYGSRRKRTFGFRNGLEIPMENWIAFLGIYLAEGCVYRPPGGGVYRIEIAASERVPEKRKRVYEILRKLPFSLTPYSDRFTIFDKRLFVELGQLGNVYDKRVPRYVMDLPIPLIETFLKAFCLGDGHTYPNGGRIFFSVSEGLIDDLQELILRTGGWSTKHSRPPRDTNIGGRVISAKNMRKQFHLYWWDENKQGLSISRKHHLDRGPYEGDIFCLEVPNHTLITRRNGLVLVSGNSCVGFACAALKEFQEVQQRIWTPFKDSSEMFIYWGAKDRDQWPGQEGTSIRAALKVLAQRGVPTEAGWPYVPAAAPGHRPPTKPAWWSYGVARWAKIGHYYRLSSISEIKEWLYLQGPIVAGIGVGTTAFNPVEHEGCPGKSYVAIPESVLGGHAVLLVSYNEAFKLIGFKNSWGAGWGNRGFGFFSYEYLGLFGFDFWAVADW